MIEKIYVAKTIKEKTYLVIFYISEKNDDQYDKTLRGRLDYLLQVI